MAVPYAEMDLYCRLKRCKRHKVSLEASSKLPHRTQLFRCLANLIQFSLFFYKIFALYIIREKYNNKEEEEKEN